MQLNGLLITNIALLVVNILTVAANVYLPRLIDKSEIGIVSVDTLVDEQEIRVANSTAYVLATVIQARPDGDRFFENKRCFEALNAEGFVPASCKELYISTLETMKKNSYAERDEKLSALNSIEQYDRRKLVEILEESRPLGFISTFYNEVFFNLLAVDNLIKPELEEDMRAALLNSARGLVDREFRYIEFVDSALDEIQNDDSRRQETSQVVLRAALLNSGFRAG